MVEDRSTSKTIEAVFILVRHFKTEAKVYAFKLLEHSGNGATIKDGVLCSNERLRPLIDADEAPVSSEFYSLSVALQRCVDVEVMFAARLRRLLFMNSLPDYIQLQEPRSTRCHLLHTLPDHSILLMNSILYLS